VLDKKRRRKKKEKISEKERKNFKKFVSK